MARFGWLRTAGRGLTVAALAVLIIGGLVTDGRVRTTAFALVAVGLLLGFVVVSLGHAHEAGRLPHHLTFAAVFVAGCVVGSHLWEATTGILPDPIAAGIGVGVWVGPLGPGASSPIVARSIVSSTTSADRADDDATDAAAGDYLLRTRRPCVHGTVGEEATTVAVREIRNQYSS
ncbi:hypothetical protein [Halorientalis litorea]|jgi:hypothetical protein|uniref:hypothetical protein n=1 Tax=Halorientalis litorea TaxID=2931977 RepID=UPI001FF2D292|nr:hypothetical protein [Halorientalis litorea]